MPDSINESQNMDDRNQKSNIQYDNDYFVIHHFVSLSDFKCFSWDWYKLCFGYYRWSLLNWIFKYVRKYQKIAIVLFQQFEWNKVNNLMLSLRST
jgi:hypothetical protein